MGGSACLWARERPPLRGVKRLAGRTLPEGGFTPHEDVENRVPGSVEHASGEKRNKNAELSKRALEALGQLDLE